LAELQAAAEGVPGWHAFLSRYPQGQELVDSITKLHARRGRLAWLQRQGLVSGKAKPLPVLTIGEAAFKRKHPEYPGDVAAAAAADSQD
jgi:hypothetical protein